MILALAPSTAVPPVQVTPLYLMKVVPRGKPFIWFAAPTTGGRKGGGLV